jgi:SAM-dependent methyltransferase
LIEAAVPAEPVARGCESADRRSTRVPKTDYDDFAAAYSTDNETNLLNGHYERPAMLGLAGDVSGRRILDAGCGSGPLSAALRDRGAIVSGFDLSAAMIELARARLGAGADLVVHDLAEPLPYPDAAFDDVVASLVLHYLEDWTEPLAELRRVLEPGGRLILSTHHPMVYPALNPGANYFDVTEFSFDAEHAGRTVVYTSWHRPLQAMTDAFAAGGFRISVISEPPVAPDTPADLLPPGLEHPVRFISFIFFVLEAC